MIVQCPKCGSKNTYEIGNGHGCRMCGKQFPKEGAAPIVLTKVFNERKKDMQEEIKKYPSGKIGICINCHREKFIADKFGRCETCSAAVRGLDMGTTEYIDALIAVKARLTDPSRKHKASLRKSLKRIFKKKHDGSVPDKPTPPPPPPRRKSTLDMTVTEVARTGMPRIVELINAEIAGHMAEVDKLQKAKAIIGRI